MERNLTPFIFRILYVKNFFKSYALNSSSGRIRIITGRKKANLTGWIRNKPGGMGGPERGQARPP
ncbi:Hypothetical protein FKW44_005367, partial [Caligus rogercresseyi]